MNKLKEAYELFSSKLEEIKKEKKILPVYICLGGSYAYGLETENSDVDIRGVFISGKENYLGFETIEQVEIKRENESDTIYDIKKFTKLAMDNNPNILEMLFVKPEHVFYVHDYFKPYLENKDLFLSKKCKYSYSGYSYSQLKRIQGHYDWLINPLEEPKEENYQITRYRNKITDKIIPERDFFAKEKRINIISESSGGSMFESVDNWEKISTLDKKSYKKALSKYKQYESWKANRNKERSELESKYSYDTKHAGHLFRLLISAEKILKEKKLETYLDEDSLKFIFDIKNGVYSYPEVIEIADKYSKKLDDLYEASSLRKSPDFKTIQKIMIKTIENHIKE